MDTSPAGRRRKRSWPEALKQEIVAATREPGASVSRVARRYDVNANQVFTWRKRYCAESIVSAELRLMPVAVTPDTPHETAARRGEDMIEIELVGGYRVRVGNGVKAAALRVVLDVLERR